ncbi:unnamed protein product [Ectocarpus sp. CCAP 1310/34]|nr:unnamed protein product [Ectocarpus sp. CCAP 1310/34]
MCCWSNRVEEEPVSDNTDVCRYESTEFPGESEGDVHCHGWVWPEGSSDDYIEYLALDVAYINHVEEKGYFGQRVCPAFRVLRCATVWK